MHLYLWHTQQRIRDTRFYSSNKRQWNPQRQKEKWREWDFFCNLHGISRYHSRARFVEYTLFCIDTSCFCGVVVSDSAFNTKGFGFDPNRPHIYFFAEITINTLDKDKIDYMGGNSTMAYARPEITLEFSVNYNNPLLVGSFTMNNFINLRCVCVEIKATIGSL